MSPPPPLHFLSHPGWQLIQVQRSVRSPKINISYYFIECILHSTVWCIKYLNYTLIHIKGVQNEIVKTTWNFLNMKTPNHCKLTRRRRSNSIDINVKNLWLRCSSSSDFTHKCKKNKFIRLHITNSKHFCSFQSLCHKRSYDKIHSRFQSSAHFT